MMKMERLKTFVWIIMSIEKNKNYPEIVCSYNLSDYLKNFHIYYQCLCARNQFLILESYAKIRKKKRSKNELEKPFNKL